MSFWSDASPATKGAIVVGSVLIVVAAAFAVMDPGGSEEATVQQRGLAPAEGGGEGGE